MSYPPEMRESIEKVEATRPQRLQETFPLMSPEEKQRLLEQFHPDYRTDGFREILAGPNKGERAMAELVEVLEGRSHLTADTLALEQIDLDTDVLVIGGGGAGASAALAAREQGAGVVLATKLRFGDANTMMAQGGIQAADRPNDAPPIHYLDAIGGGGFTNDPALVEVLVMDAPATIQWLEGMGVMFDKEPDGSMTVIHGGGTSRMRMHSAGDYSGASIMRAVRDEVLSWPALRDVPRIDGRAIVLGTRAQSIEHGKEAQILADAEPPEEGALVADDESDFLTNLCWSGRDIQSVDANRPFIGENQSREYLEECRLSIGCRHAPGWDHLALARQHRTERDRGEI